jgi:hypothetical protein
MQHRKHKVALFLVVQGLAVAAMIFVLQAGRRTDCAWGTCAGASAASVIVTLLVILGELGILAAALRVDGPVWKTLLGLGILALIVAMFVIGASWGAEAPRRVAVAAAAWHLVTGLLLCGSGTAAGVWELLGRLRRRDEALPEDRASSAMWPLD